MAEQPWTGKTDRRIRSERNHQVILGGSTDGRPFLFIGRKRGGAGGGEQIGGGRCLVTRESTEGARPP